VLQNVQFLIYYLFLQIGNACRICLILDNATWHNAQTEESKLPKRAWRKDKIEEWLQNHYITYDQDLTKAEMLEIAFSNAPLKEYLVKIRFSVPFQLTRYFFR
jgi:hypothetical protein